MQIPVFEAKNKLSALLARVERGDEVTITRRGIAIAKLVPVAPTFDREKARKAAEGLRRTSRGAMLGGISVKDLVNEGRS